MWGEYRRRAAVYLAAGAAISIIAGLLLRGTPLGPLAIGLGNVVWIIGCWNYARGKGYPGPVGLLGLLNCVGLLILVLLPDRAR